VSTTNETGESSQFTNDEVNGWDDWWKYKNVDFNAYVESLRESLPEANFKKNKKFFLSDGNDRHLV